MQQPTVKIELLPQGEFSITLGETVVKGRFSMYALDRFCSSKDLNYLEAIGKITLGMTIREYAELVEIGIQDKFYRDHPEKCPWNVTKIMDEIFDPLGFGSQELLGLFKHAVGRLTNVKEKAKADKEHEAKTEEKKKRTGRTTKRR